VNRVRVLIVDDHPVVREGLRAVLGTEPDIDVVDECGSGAEAVRLAADLRPDVVLMDLRLPDLDGVEATRRIVAAGSAGVLVLTTYDTDGDIARAVAAGATGYLLKESPRQELTAAVRAAARGETVLAATVAAKLVTSVRGGRPAPRTRRAAMHCRRSVEPGDRAAAVHQRDHREEPRHPHLREALGQRPNGRRHGRDRPRHPGAADLTAAGPHRRTFGREVRGRRAGENSLVRRAGTSRAGVAASGRG
jgi:DNA-binding NarL/FixJ family response regulator